MIQENSISQLQLFKLYYFSKYLFALCYFIQKKLKSVELCFTVFIIVVLNNFVVYIVRLTDGISKHINLGWLQIQNMNCNLLKKLLRYVACFNYDHRSSRLMISSVAIQEKKYFLLRSITIRWKTGEG